MRWLLSLLICLGCLGCRDRVSEPPPKNSSQIFTFTTTGISEAFERSEFPEVAQNLRSLPEPLRMKIDRVLQRQIGNGFGKHLRAALLGIEEILGKKRAGELVERLLEEGSARDLLWLSLESWDVLDRALDRPEFSLLWDNLSAEEMVLFDKVKDLQPLLRKTPELKSIIKQYGAIFPKLSQVWSRHEDLRIFSRNRVRCLSREMAGLPVERFFLDLKHFPVEDEQKFFQKELPWLVAGLSTMCSFRGRSLVGLGQAFQEITEERIWLASIKLVKSLGEQEHFLKQWMDLDHATFELLVKRMLPLVEADPKIVDWFLGQDLSRASFSKVLSSFAGLTSEELRKIGHLGIDILRGLHKDPESLSLLHDLATTPLKEKFPVKSGRRFLDFADSMLSYLAPGVSPQRASVSVYALETVEKFSIITLDPLLKNQGCFGLLQGHYTIALVLECLDLPQAQVAGLGEPGLELLGKDTLFIDSIFGLMKTQDRSERQNVARWLSVEKPKLASLGSLLGPVAIKAIDNDRLRFEHIQPFLEGWKKMRSIESVQKKAVVRISPLIAEKWFDSELTLKDIYAYPGMEKRILSPKRALAKFLFEEIRHEKRVPLYLDSEKAGVFYNLSGLEQIMYYMAAGDFEFMGMRPILRVLGHLVNNADAMMVDPNGPDVQVFEKLISNIDRLLDFGERFGSLGFVDLETKGRIRTLQNLSQWLREAFKRGSLGYVGKFLKQYQGVSGIYRMDRENPLNGILAVVHAFGPRRMMHTSRVFGLEKLSVDEIDTLLSGLNGQWERMYFESFLKIPDDVAKMPYLLTVGQILSKIPKLSQRAFLAKLDWSDSFVLDILDILSYGENSPQRQELFESVIPWMLAQIPAKTLEELGAKKSLRKDQFCPDFLKTLGNRSARQIWDAFEKVLKENPQMVSSDSWSREEFWSNSFGFLEELLKNPDMDKVWVRSLRLLDE